MHGDDGFGFEKFAGIGRFTRRHGEKIADRQHSDFRRIEIANDGHIAEDVRVAGVVNLHTIRELKHVAASFAAVDDLVAILDTAGMDSMHHGDFHADDRLRAALVHGGNLLHAFALQPQAELIDSDRKRVVLFADFNRVADVVAVSVSAEQNIGLPDLLVALGAHGVPHDPRIDEERLAFRSLDAESRVPEPGEFDAGESHGSVLESKASSYGLRA